jgi:hypothetical protein
MRVMLFDRARGVALAAAMMACATAAYAQTYECERLRAQIASLAPTASPQTTRYAAAAEKQRYELDRTSAYARSIGCDNRQFLIFGSPPPPQCAGLEAQMQRMRANLASLQSQARGAGGLAQRQALQARFDATCRPGANGLFESLFGSTREQIPIDDIAPPMPTEDLHPRGGSLAVCVRTCDGGYFPVSYSARSSRYDSLEELCQAQCPGAKTALYTMPPSGTIDQAVGTDGEPYTSMENAGKFRKTYNPTCACKPQNQSWVQALAQAEELLGRKAAGDLIVTPEKSEELSRPKLARVTADPPTANDAAPAAKGAPANAPRYGLKDGDTHEKTEPGGHTRRVRVIGPKL